MFRVDGDIIEYDGKPFAVITMPLCGDKIDAIDALNGQNWLYATEAETMLKETMADVNQSVTILIDNAWLPGDTAMKLRKSLLSNVKGAFMSAVTTWIRSK